MTIAAIDDSAESNVKSVRIVKNYDQTKHEAKKTRIGEAEGQRVTVLVTGFR